MTTPRFEQGPIRPPSEARSLLVRVIRNCTWNRCTFCPVYKGSKASQRQLEEILADVDAMAVAAERLGGRGAANERMLAALHGGDVPPEAVQVALFLRDGARHAFLQDADPCAVTPEKLAAVLERLRSLFPSVERVTTYGRASTLARRGEEELGRLAAAGLTRVHLGLESGSDVVLKEVCKGVTQAELVTAGRNVLAVGLELCFYVMPGLGGVEASAEHVRGTVEVLRAVASAAPPGHPLVVRLRTTAVAPGTPLAERAAAGRFTLPDDVQVADELRKLLTDLGDARLELRSDHSLNLLPELEGYLPEDSARLLGLLDEFLGLSAEERAWFALGARMGVFRRLADRHDPQRRAVLRAQVPWVKDADERDVLNAAVRIRSHFI
jgi:radical SAM superfamily enzyme YgiQ (UPF0313 family)